MAKIITILNKQEILESLSYRITNGNYAVDFDNSHVKEHADGWEITVITKQFDCVNPGGNACLPATDYYHQKVMSEVLQTETVKRSIYEHLKSEFGNKDTPSEGA